jgi:predicted nucleotidyltransferase
MDKNEIIKILEEVYSEIKVKYKVKRIGLFGSVLKHTENKNSDIDLLTEFEESADLLDLIGLSDFLSEKLKQKVDIVPRGALREELKESIEKEVAFI